MKCYILSDFESKWSTTETFSNCCNYCLEQDAECIQGMCERIVYVTVRC